MGVEDKVNWETIGLWVGIGITFILGVFNLFWGGRILTRREKVILRESEFEVKIIERDDKVERIFIRSSFKLVRVGGEQDIFLEKAYLQLNEIVCRELEPYFKLSPMANVYWISTGLYEAEKKTLKFNESRQYQIMGSFDVKTETKISEKRGIFNNIKENIEKLRLKYLVILIDTKGKKWEYRLPKKWYNIFLPKEMWLRVI